MENIYILCNDDGVLFVTKNPVELYKRRIEAQRCGKAVRVILVKRVEER